MPEKLGNEVLWLCPSLDDTVGDTSTGSGHDTITLNDLSGNSNDGTFINGGSNPLAAKWVDDTTNGGVRAISLDGSDDYISVAHSAELSLAGDWAISLHVKLAASSVPDGSYVGLINKGKKSESPGENHNYGILVRNNTADESSDNRQAWAGYFERSNGGSARLSSLAATTTSWTNVIVEYDESEDEMSIYIDGTLDDTLDTTGYSPDTNSEIISIGRLDSNDSGFEAECLLDDIRIFPNTLTAQQKTDLASARGYEPPTEVVDCAAIGGVTDRSAVVMGYVTTTNPIHARVSLDSTVLYTTEKVVPDTYGIVKIPINNLEPDTVYTVEFYDDSTRDSTTVLSVRTFPKAGEAANVKIMVSGCARGDEVPGTGNANVSNHPVFAQMASQAISKGVHLYLAAGDNIYLDTRNSLAVDQITMHAAALSEENQKALWTVINALASYDDHDYADNDSGSGDDTNNGATEGHRRFWPSYNHAAGPGYDKPIYKDCLLGRVHVFCCDVRKHRVTGTTILGDDQLAWLKATMLASPAKFFVLNLSVSWLDVASTPTKTDPWQGTPLERQELADFFAANGFVDKILITGSDTHAIVVDDGTNSDFTTAGGTSGPVCAAFGSLDSTPTPGTTTITASHGMHRNDGQWGLIEIDDDGTTITVTITGYRYANPIGPETQVVQYSFTVDASDQTAQILSEEFV